MEEEHTVIRKSRVGGSKDARSAAAVNRAMATGDVEVLKKMTAASNKQHGQAAPGNLARIENETEVFKVETVSRSLSQAVSKARQDKGLTQKALATAINEKPQVIGEIESGKAKPDHAVLGKLERVLGVRLRGSNIGAPFK
jgi:putative transcription factor